MRDAVVPVEVPATAPERRDELAQLGVHRAAVVALVVVLQDHLPVRGDLVDQPVPGAKMLQRVLGEPGARTRTRPTWRPRPGAARAVPGNGAVRAGTVRRAACRRARRSSRGRDSGSPRPRSRWAAGWPPAGLRPPGPAGSRGAGTGCSGRPGRRRS